MSIENLSTEVPAEESPQNANLESSSSLNEPSNENESAKDSASESLEELREALRAEQQQRRKAEKKLKDLEKASSQHAQSKQDNPPDNPSPDNWRSVLERRTKEAEAAIQKAQAAEEQLNSYRVQTALREVARSYTRPEVVEDLVALHSKHFEWDDSGVITKDGVSAEEYFEDLIQRQPFYSNRKASNSYGVQGGGSRDGKPVSIKRSELRGLSPDKLATVLEQIENGRAVLVD